MDDKYLGRHIGLLKENGQERIKTLRVNVVGAGALGGYLVQAMVKMGFENVQVFDYDEVDETNISNQIYGIPQIGMRKIDALKNICKGIDPDVEYEFINEKVGEKTQLDGEVIIMAVDSIEARAILLEKAIRAANCKVLLDARLGKSLINFFGIDMTNYDEINYYDSEFIFPSDEAAEIPCTEKTFMGPVMQASALYCSYLWSYVNNEFRKQPFNIAGDTRLNYFDRLSRKQISELMLEMG